MKQPFRLTILLAAAAFSASNVRATDDFALGDLALVFYKLTGPAPGVFDTGYYVFNLGPVAPFRENTQNNVPVTTINNTISSSNISADLVAVFGESWEDSGEVRMMAVTAITPGAVTTNDDPSRNFYFSAGRTSLDSGQKNYDPATSFAFFEGNTRFPDTIGANLRASIANSLTTFIFTATNGAISSGNVVSGANPSGNRLTTSYIPNLSSAIPPSSSTFFALGSNPTATLGAGLLPGSANVEAAVDIFRVINTATGSDLTSGSSVGNAIVGQGQFIGCITLDTAGELKVQAVGVPPARGNYASWATENSVTGGTDGDSDFDGIKNLVEYGLNLSPAGSDGSPGTFASNTLTFTKRPVAITNADVSWVIETSTSLAPASWSPAVTQAAGDSATAISYTFPPPGPTKNFARLRVQPVTP